MNEIISIFTKAAAFVFLTLAVSSGYSQTPQWTPPAPLNSYYDQDYGTDEVSPQIATDGGGNWVTVWHNAAGVYGSHSTNVGRSWNNPAVIDSGYKIRSSDSLKLLYTGAGVWVCLWTELEYVSDESVSSSSLMLSRSTDGYTWSPAVSALTLDTSNIHDVESDGNGIIVATLGTQLLRSTDSGETWVVSNTPGLPEYYPHIARLAYAGDGKWLHAISQHNLDSSKNIDVAISSDNGSTWGAFTGVSTTISLDDMEARGEIVVIAGHKRTHLDQLYFITSENGGQTWSGPVYKDAIGGLNKSTFSLVADPAGNWTLIIDRMSVVQSIFHHDIIAMYSSDPGTSWTPFETIVVEDDLHEIRPSLATDGTGGWVSVYQVEEPYTSNLELSLHFPEFDIKSVYSVNNGSTWSLPQLVNPDGLIDLPVINDSSIEMASGENGAVVAVWEASGGGSGHIMFARSDDYGQTWSNTAPVLPHRQYNVDHQPKIFYRGNGVWLLLGNLNSWRQPSFAVSYDNGFTWGNFEIFYGYTAAGSHSTNGTMVKAHLAGGDPYQYGLARLQKEALYWDEPFHILEKPGLIANSTGNQWFALTYAATPHYAPQPLGVYTSNDDGRTWIENLSINQVPLHAILSSSHEGTVTAAWVDDNVPAVVNISRTTDNGLTWSLPVQLHKIPYESVGRVRIASAGSGQWMAVWALAESREEWYNVRLVTSFSRDDGATWSAPAFISDEIQIPENTAQFDPAIVGAEGKLVTAWTSRSDHRNVNFPYGVDEDLFYSFGLFNPPLTAARDWQLFE